jgi:hypothetical protein
MTKYLVGYRKVHKRKKTEEPWHIISAEWKKKPTMADMEQTGFGWINDKGWESVIVKRLKGTRIKELGKVV